MSTCLCIHPIDIQTRLLMKSHQVQPTGLQSRETMSRRPWPRDCSLRKILVHPQKKSEKSEIKSRKSKDFLQELKTVYLIWEWTTPRIQCLNTFLFLKSSYTKKNFEKSEKNPKKSEKSEKIQGFFWEFKIRTLYLGVNNPSSLDIYPFLDASGWNLSRCSKTFGRPGTCGRSMDCCHFD